MPSDRFEDEFERCTNKPSEGDYGRARALSITGDDFNFHYCGSRPFTSLDHAICCTQQALKELMSHEELKAYATLHTDLLREKAEKSLALGDFDSYISGLQLFIEHLEEGSCKESMKRQLGCAYYNRGAVSNNSEDLDIAIQSLEGCFETPYKIYPKEAICLGGSLLLRYQRDKSLHDLDLSVDLLRKGLGAVPRNESHHDSLRDVGLEYLASACAIVNCSLCGDEMRSRVLNNVEAVLSFTPSDNKLVGRVHKQWLELTMTQSLTESDSVRKVRDTISASLVDEVLHSRNPRVRREVPPTITKLFINEPLSDKKHIRLIKLLPGRTEDFILCEIFEVGFDSLPHYEALSYVWGDSKQTEKIGLNASIQEVTKNLHSALLRLRRSQTERILWVDALCITQANLDEKRHQIALMRDIYKRASTVTMWLGEPEVQESPVRLMTEETEASTQKSSLELLKVVIDVPNSRTMVTLKSQAPVKGESPMVHIFRKEEVPTLIQKLQWLEPFLLGCQTIAAVSEDGVPGFSNMVYDTIQAIEWKEFCELLFHNIRFRHLPGPQLQVFDWRSPDKLPSFFKAPQTRTMWPVLGAFTLIHCFSEYKHFSELPFFGGADIDLTYYSGIMWRKSVEELDKILTSPYWERAWILQEVVLAQNPIVYYGPHIMAFTKLLQAAWAFEIHYHKCCSKWGERAYRKEHTYWMKLMHGFDKFEYMDLLRHAHGTPSFYSGSYSGDKARNSETYSFSFSDILRTGLHGRKATDPRDLIYGILALVEGGTGLEADYTLSVTEVFTQATMHIIRQEQSLAVLLFNELGRNAQHGLPSWVPDWTAHAKHFPTKYPAELYKPSHEMRPFHAELEGGWRLHVRGVKVDTIRKVSRMCTVGVEHTSELVKLLEEWRREAGLDSPDRDQDLEQDRGQDRGGDSGDLDEKFWRSVFADAMFEHDMEHRKTDSKRRESETIRRFEPRDVVKVSAWWSWLRRQTVSLVGLGLEWNSLRTLSDPEGFDVVTDRFWHATEARKMIFTERNYMGTGPSVNGEDVELGDAQAGDEVYWLFGMRLPVILRRLHERKQPTGTKWQRYEFVGPCYLHGVMDGEALIDGTGAVEEVYLC